MTTQNSELNDRQKRFADEYLIDCNARKAAERAGYSPTSGKTLMRNPKIRRYISEQLRLIHNDNTADAQEVLEFLSAVMRGEEKEPVVLRVNGEQEVEMVELAARERIKAAELIGKRFGMFSESKEQAAAEPVIICGGDSLED